MPYPKHPKNILVKNEFYPEGLNEEACWNYYQSIKDRLLMQVFNKDLIIFIAIGVNKTTVLRHGKMTRFVRLNRTNFDDIFHPRMLSIHTTIHTIEDFLIIDIDCSNFYNAKEATIDTYNFVTSQVPFIDDAWIKFTGKNSFHIMCETKRPMYIDRAKILMKDSLEKSVLAQKYDIDEVRRPDSNIPNLDLSPNKYKGGYISLYSLSTIGLRCIKVPYYKIRAFKREDAIIQTT